MASVKQLMAKFSKPSSGVQTTSPVSFEEQKKLARQRELEEIRLAREKAKLYNATLRAKTIQLAKEQSARTRGLISPRTASSFNFDIGAANPGFLVTGTTSVKEEDEDDEGTVIIDHKFDGSSLVPSFSTAPLERSEESFEGKSEEKKDVLTEMSCPPTNQISPRISRLSPSEVPMVTISPPSSSMMLLPPAPEDISNNALSRLSSRHSGNKSMAAINASLTSAPSMTDVTIPPPATNISSFPQRHDSSASLRKDSDLGSVSSMVGIPDGGFDEIHEAVRFNRPSVSDLLLRPTLGERNYSVTSVGPMVETPEEEPCRLLPGVDIRTVLHTFYLTYAPEKMEDLELVLRHFKGRSEALLFTLECKYFVAISAEGLVTPYRPSEAPPEAERVEDERHAARRSTMMSTATDLTDFTTDSYKGYVPADVKDGGLPSTLANSWAVRPKHDSGGRGREGRKTAIMMKKAGSDLL